METLQTNYKIDIVHTLVRFRFATREQLCRLFPGNQPAAAEALLQLIDERSVGFRDFYIPDKGDHKPGRGHSTVKITVCYLLSASKKYGHPLDFNLPNYTRNAAPNKWVNQHLYHELNVMETYLWFKENFNVSGVKVENEIKGFAHGTVADLRVYFNGSYQDCEIVVQNSRPDIENKAQSLWWFTPSLRQADVIEHTHSAVVQLLPPLLPEVKEVSSARKLSKFHQRLLTYMERFTLPISVPALSKLMNYHRATLSETLADLERWGMVYSIELCANPGKSIGRPSKYYSLKELIDRSYEMRRSIVDTSKLAQLA